MRHKVGVRATPSSSRSRFARVLRVLRGARRVRCLSRSPAREVPFSSRDVTALFAGASLSAPTRSALVFGRGLGWLRGPRGRGGAPLRLITSRN